MATNRRRFRVAEKIQELVATHVLRLSDPRLHLVTITSVVVTPDLRLAKVYWVATDAEGRSAEIAEGFEAAASYLRTQIAKDLGTRTTPELKFFYDDTFDVQQRVDELMDTIK